MNVITIPGTAISMSQVGFGCGRLYGGGEHARSARLVEAALRHEIRHFDTAPYYGEGASEQVLGEVLRGEKNVTFTTKFGLGRPAEPAVPGMARRIYRSIGKPLLAAVPGLKSALLSLRRTAPVAEAAPVRQPFPRDELRREVELSLKALQRDRVDILLVHEFDRFELTDADRLTFQALIADGVVGAFGIGADRIVAEDPGFGTIVQGRFSEDVSPVTGLRLFHGLLRHGTGAAGSPADAFAQVVAQRPDAAFLFSASTPGQIDQLAAALSRSR